MAMVTSLALAASSAVFADGAEMTEEELVARMPGLPSFIVFAILAVALYFLLRNMNARLRRMSYREKEREDLEQAELERAELEGNGLEGAGEDSGDVPGGAAEEGPGSDSADDQRLT